MQTYYLTVYAQTGEALLMNPLKQKMMKRPRIWGKEKLNENGHADITHRLVSPDGRLLLFHR